VRKGVVDGDKGFRWQTVDEFEMPDHQCGFDSRAHGLGVDGRGNLYAVGRSFDAAANGTINWQWIVRRASRAGSDWIVRHSATGEAGSWTVSDDCQAISSSKPASKASGSVNKAADGSLAAPPPEYCRGFAIVSDSAAVYVGAAANAGPVHALVRKLEMGHSAALAASRAP